MIFCSIGRFKFNISFSFIILAVFPLLFWWFGALNNMQSNIDFIAVTAAVLNILTVLKGKESPHNVKTKLFILAISLSALACIYAVWYFFFYQNYNGLLVFLYLIVLQPSLLQVYLNNTYPDTSITDNTI